MPFQTFIRKSQPPARLPWATLQSKGYLSFSALAYDAMGKPETVELLFDPDKKLIGVRPVDPDAPSAYPVRTQSGTTTHIIAIQSFLNFFNIDRPDTRRFRVKFEGEMMLIDLNEEGEKIVGPRASGAAAS